MQELRYAFRQLRKAPVFTTVAALTLALGIGANTAIFTLLDQALIRSLPVSHAEQLVRLQFTGLHSGSVSFYGGNASDYFSFPAYRQLRDKNEVLSGLLANAESQVGIQWQGRPELVDGEIVSGNYFDVLGVRPAIGRLFVPADDAAQNGAPVVVLSFNYWKSRFDSDPGVIGKALMIDAHPFTIVGVVRPGFRSVISGYSPQLFVPMTTEPLIWHGENDLENDQMSWLTVVGRLKPGESRATAEAGISPLWHALREEQLLHADDADRLKERGFLKNSKLLLLDNARGFSPLRDNIGVPLLIVMGMVGLVLLMATINVSSLLLVRGAGRVREMAVRYSMGATRWQIVRQLMTEGVVLGVIGGCLGMALAPLVSSVLAAKLVDASVNDVPFTSYPDTRVLVFNFGIALLASFLFSLAPALRFLRPDLVTSLKQQAPTALGSQLRFRRISVGLQIGLSLLLLIGAGLFVQTLRNLRNVDVGFSTDHLLSFGIDPELAGYKPNQTLPLHQRTLRMLAALPGVQSVAASTDPELMGMETRTSVTTPGETEPIIVEAPRTTPGFFATTGITLLAGRDFTDQDTIGKPLVAIVNARFARAHFGSPQNALGNVLVHGGPRGKDNLEIVGVVGDSKHLDLRSDTKETLYRAIYQAVDPDFMQFYLHTWQSPDAAKETIRSAMRQLDSNLVVDGLRTMDEQISQSTSNDRLIAMLAVSFGALATLMAAIGLYGVLAYSTAQRTHEIGIRMALGAQRSAVIRLVLSDVLWLAGISIAITVPVALLASRAVRSQLYNVSPADPLVIVSGVLLVGLVVMVSASLPARRAANVEPMLALRTE